MAMSRSRRYLAIQQLCEADGHDGHDDQHRHEGTQKQARTTPQEQNVCHRRHQPEAEHHADDAELKGEDDELLHAQGPIAYPAAGVAWRQLLEASGGTIAELREVNWAGNGNTSSHDQFNDLPL